MNPFPSSFVILQVQVRCYPSFETETKYLARVVGYYKMNGGEPNARYIERYAESIGFNELNQYNVAQKYYGVEKRVQLMYFERGLRDETLAQGASVDEKIKTEMRAKAINKTLGGDLSFDPTDYVIVGPDYSRDSRIDNYYRNHFSQLLSRAFDGHCCKCGEGMGQLEYDHFWWPKSSGGNFLMRHKSGTYVNNCIPLCRSCNSSKGSRNSQDFFSDEEIEHIANVSQSLNSQLNTQMIDFQDADFEGRAF